MIRNFLILTAVWAVTFVWVATFGQAVPPEPVAWFVSVIALGVIAS